MLIQCQFQSSGEGIIEWKFDLSGTGYLIDSVNIVSTDQCYKTESSGEGIIEWKFDLSGTGYLIDSVNIVSTDQCYKTGVGTKTCTDFVGESSVTLMAKLKGGVGDLAWQHAQLFRQSSDSREFSFVVNIKLISPKPNS
uniref:PAW domain-containing protein n=1 Tax=Timema poppense TaxID=170557 RepID=A0A7R9CM18_TIMPO|nr:unnamed protein product [Timema poppensis]